MVFTALKYIETSYKTGTLEELAAQLHLAPYTLSRLLKHHTGQNFKQLLQQRRLQQAAYLLGNTRLPPTQCWKPSATKTAAISTAFSGEKYGCSPAEYRRRQTTS